MHSHRGAHSAHDVPRACECGRGSPSSRCQRHSQCRLIWFPTMTWTPFIQSKQRPLPKVRSCCTCTWGSTAVHAPCDCSPVPQCATVIYHHMGCYYYMCHGGQLHVSIFGHFLNSNAALLSNFVQTATHARVHSRWVVHAQRLYHRQGHLQPASRG